MYGSRLQPVDVIELQQQTTNFESTLVVGALRSNIFSTNTSENADYILQRRSYSLSWVFL